jgi:hypothetical protein
MVTRLEPSLTLSNASRVDGKATLNGSLLLARMTDVSAKLEAEFSELASDRATGEISVNVRVRNSSPDTLGGRVVARILAARSGFGELTVAGDTQRDRAGSPLLDFSSSLPPSRVLPPGASNSPTRVRLRLSLPVRVQRFPYVGTHVDTDLATLDWRLYAERVGPGVPR